MTIIPTSISPKNHIASSPSTRALLLVALSALLVAVAPIALLVVGLPETVNWVTLALIGVNIMIWDLPIWLQLRRGQVDFFHPLFFAAVYFALPMIVVKGVFLAIGGDSYWLTLINDAPFFVNLALIYTAVGWLAVLFGFYLPLSGRISRRLPLPSLIAGERRMVLLPVLVAFVFGVGFNLILLREGAFGSALSEFSGDLSLVSVMRPLSGWMSMAFFLLVFGAVRYHGKREWLVATIGAGVILFGSTFLAGSRSALFGVTISFAMAGFYSRYPHVDWRKFVPLLAFVGLTLLFGVLVFTQFRNLRSNMFGTASVSVKDTLSLTGTALQQSASQSLDQQLSFVSASLIERFVALDMLSVTLARAESLKSAEQAAGIDNNIIKELIVGFIPRTLWADKPLVGEFGLWFTRIYLDVPGSISSNGPTMLGDLYRNFGFWGVPIGMFLVGVYLRILYGSLIQRGIHSPLAPLFYVSLYGVFNWEGTFTPFFTNGLRVVFALVTMTALIYVLGGWRTNKKTLVERQKFDRALDDRGRII